MLSQLLNPTILFNPVLPSGSAMPLVNLGDPWAMLHWTADWYSTMQQIQLSLSAIEHRLTVLESGHVVAGAQTAERQSTVPLTSSARPSISTKKSSTVPPSYIPRWVARSNSNAPLAIPQAWDLLPMNEKTPRYKCVLKLPDSPSLTLSIIRGRALNKPTTSPALGWLPFWLVWLGTVVASLSLSAAPISRLVRPLWSLESILLSSVYAYLVSSVQATLHRPPLKTM